MCQRATGCSDPLMGVLPATTATTTTLGPTVASVPPYERSVECDTINDRFTVKIPLSQDGDFLLGWDMLTANCGYTSEDPRGVVYSYKFTECGTRMDIDEDDSNKLIYENNLRFALKFSYFLISTFFSIAPLLVNGVYRSYGSVYNFRCVIDRLGHVDNNFVNTTTGQIVGDILPVYVITDFMISGAG